ncbi:MAG TPA: 2-amino-4-hydroxy-6-hydroxymethyldihydropteridine diphosphokinase [Tepidisphaeraceae bacterium]|nr:2-amino-4-hydroxy-6-hydroxymethyldihydropteridine diphosphokinase [Tepidisphaeraceae bacterium]
MDAYIGLGTNLGDRAGNIRLAVIHLAATPDLDVCRLSSVMENPAVGGPADSPPYFNAVAKIETDLTPRRVLDRLLAIEREMGRVRRQRWEPRIIDLDLLLYDDQVINEPGLTIPHPRIGERRFVLKPLAELAPDLVHPVTGRTIRALLDELPASS